MYKSINAHGMDHQHDFPTLEEALLYFATSYKIKFLTRREVLYGGMTRGKNTQVLDQVLIGLFTDNGDDLGGLDADVPDIVVVIENQEPRPAPLG